MVAELLQASQRVPCVCEMTQAADYDQGSAMCRLDRLYVSTQSSGSPSGLFAYILRIVYIAYIASRRWNSPPGGTFPDMTSLHAPTEYTAYSYIRFALCAKTMRPAYDIYHTLLRAASSIISRVPLFVEAPTVDLLYLATISSISVHKILPCGSRPLTVSRDPAGSSD